MPDKLVDELFQANNNAFYNGENMLIIVDDVRTYRIVDGVAGVDLKTTGYLGNGTYTINGWVQQHTVTGTLTANVSGELRINLDAPCEWFWVCIQHLPHTAGMHVLTRAV